MILTRDLLTVDISAGGKPTMRITHNGTMTGSTTARLVFDPDAVVGLEDVPSMRRGKSSRPYSHGSFPERGFSESRMITFTGHAFAKNASELHALRDRFAWLLNSGEFLNFKFSFSGGNRSTVGSLDNGLSWVQQLDTYAKWKFEIICPDPRLYGIWKYSQMGSSDLDRTGLSYDISYPLEYVRDLPKPVAPVLQNIGNSESWPVFTLNANTSGFSIFGAGNVIKFSGATRRGNPVTIDSFTGSATVSGVDRSYILTKREWFSVPPYSTLKPRLDIIASPDVEADIMMGIKHRDTWI